MRTLKLFILLVTFTLGGLCARSQSDTFEDLVFTQDSLNALYPREKIFIHHDKPIYKLRDTIWLKGYLLSGPVNIPNDSSRFAYIEIINAENEVVKRISTPCVMGLFAADILLHDRIFKQGEYRMRAYTRYMMNFGDSLFFESNFLIIDPTDDEWIANSQNLQPKTRNRNNAKPRQAGTSEKNMIDLQFLPEGGTFIAGKEQKLGFKAINTSGKGIDVKGVIRDSKGNIITNFASVHKGMGIVPFTPQANERYTAMLENGSSFNLPAPQTSGIILQIINRARNR